MNIFKRMKETAKPNSEKLTERRTKNERDERACRTERERERYTKWQRSVAFWKVEHMSIRCRVFRENKEMLEKCTHSENRARGNTIDVDYVWKSTTHFDLKFKHSKSFLSFSLSLARSVACFIFSLSVAVFFFFFFLEQVNWTVCDRCCYSNEFLHSFIAQRN